MKRRKEKKNNVWSANCPMCITKEKWKKKKRLIYLQGNFLLLLLLLTTTCFCIISLHMVQFTSNTFFFFSPFFLPPCEFYMKKAVVKAALYLLSKECCSCFYDNKTCIYIETKRKGQHPLTRKRKTHISFLVA